MQVISKQFRGGDYVLKQKYALSEGYKNIKKCSLKYIGGYAEHCSSFDSRLIVFCSSELGIILLSASLTPACRLSPPISFSKDQAGAKFDDPKRKA